MLVGLLVGVPIHSHKDNRLWVGKIHDLYPNPKSDLFFIMSSVTVEFMFSNDLESQNVNLVVVDPIPKLGGGVPYLKVLIMLLCEFPLPLSDKVFNSTSLLTAPSDSHGLTKELLCQ